MLPRGRGGTERARKGLLGGWSSSFKGPEAWWSLGYFLKKGTSELKSRGWGYRREDWSRNDALGMELVTDAGTHMSGQMCETIDTELNSFLSKAKPIGAL